MDGFGIRIEGLRKRYGEGDTAVDALKGVNMTVAPGEVVGLPSEQAVRRVVEDFNRSLLMLMSEAGTAPRPK